MKQITILLFLFLISLNGQADVTLSYKTLIDKNGSQNLTYYVKDGILRLSENQSRRINLYTPSKQTFISIDEQTANISRIDRNILNKRIEQLSQQRLNKLAKVESELNKKLKNMTKTEKEVGEELVNQLKYPEFYGMHTQIKVTKTSTTKTINKIDCEVYDIKRKNKLVRQICMASQKALGISLADYQTLRNFHQFNYNTQTRLMLAMGKTDFIDIDYQEENMAGLPVEVLTLSDDQTSTELLLDNISVTPLAASLFEIPNSQN